MAVSIWLPQLTSIRFSQATHSDLRFRPSLLFQFSRSQKRGEKKRTKDAIVPIVLSPKRKKRNWTKGRTRSPRHVAPFSIGTRASQWSMSGGRTSGPRRSATLGFSMARRRKPACGGGLGVILLLRVAIVGGFKGKPRDKPSVGVPLKKTLPCGAPPQKKGSSSLACL